MPGQDIRISADQTSRFMDRLDGGLDLSEDVEDIDDSRASDLKNIKFRRGALQSETGYKKFLGPVVGTPRRPYKFVRTDQTIDYVLVTNTTFYRRQSNEWQYVSNGTSTTTDAVALAGATVISVVSVAGFAAPDRIGIILDNGSQHKTTIASINAPANDITINDAIPVGRQVDNGAVVVKAATFAGTDNDQISIVTDTANDRVIFTNGTDAIQKFTPSGGGTVTALGGLAAINVNTCKTLEIFNNTLFLGFTRESGANKPYRVRNSDIGAFEIWNAGAAGFQDFFDVDEDIKRLIKLGPFLLAYRAGSIRRGEWTGIATNLVDWNTMVSDRGITSHDSVINIEGVHFCIDETGIYEYDAGFTTRSVVENAFNLLFGVDSQISKPSLLRIFAFYVKGLRELFFLWPVGNDNYPTRIARLKLPKRSWTVREFTREVSGWGIFEATASKSWSGLTGTWAEQDFIWSSRVIQSTAPSILLCGAVDLQVYEYDFFNTTDDGTTISWSWTSKNFFSSEIEIRVDSISFSARGSLVTIEYSTDRGQNWLVYSSNFSLTGASRRYEIYKQFVSNQVMWRFSGVGAGFSLAWFGFNFGIEGEKR